MRNPYRSDPSSDGPFFGRAQELSRLVAAFGSRRDTLAAVMGGRGMGKTSLALRLKALLVEAEKDAAVHLLRRPARNPTAFISQLGALLDWTIDPVLPIESLVAGVRAQERSQVVLLIDEIEALISTEQGCDLLEGLRTAYEELGGRLGVVVFGGSELRKLLSSDVSPFLRTAQWIPLKGLSHDETASLLREPLGLAVPDALVESLWEQTGGHPLLLQRIMERAVMLGPSTPDKIHEALHLIVEDLERTLFPIWWDKLTAPGQVAYRRLLDARRPLLKQEWASVLGNGPQTLIEIMETTGIARVEGGQLLPRCPLFGEWLAQNHPATDASRVAPTPTTDYHASNVGLQPFEALVIGSVVRWARVTVEYPTLHLRSKTARGNERLSSEQHFQLGLVTALCQHELIAEPEPLSSARGRADIKVRSPADLARRACMEVKVWGGTGYKDVVKQALGYVVPEDEFACVIMVDRQASPLAERYRKECLRGGTLEEIQWPADTQASSSATYPAFVTKHPKSSGGMLRLYHFLIQLPPDAEP